MNVIYASLILGVFNLSYTHTLHIYMEQKQKTLVVQTRFGMTCLHQSQKPPELPLVDQFQYFPFRLFHSP